MTIKQLALQLAEKYNKEYAEYCKETGNIMHGSIMKADTMKKAAFCKRLDDVRAFLTCYKISYEAFNGKINGFKFCADAIEELIKLIENEKD